MAVRTVTRRGKRRLVIDFTYRKQDGTKARYRHDAEVQTRTAAHAEERRRLAAVAATGSPYAIVDEAAAKVEATHEPVGPTFGEVVESYWENYAPSKLKPSTRFGYRSAIDYHLLPRFKKTPLAGVDAGAVRSFDATLAAEGQGAAIRRNVQIVIRSIVCRYAVEAKLLPEAPRMPPLPKKAKKIPEVISAEQATAIIAAARTAGHRLVLLLAFHAGLRSCEIRALRVDDVDLKKNVVRVDEAEYRGVYGTPKSGNDREVPLTNELRAALADAICGKGRRAFVAVTKHGKPWAKNGLRNMFLRVAKRAGIVEGSTFHHLRHGFVTTLLDRGVGAHIVQDLAGHADLTTTQRYAHALSKQKHRAIDVLNEKPAEKAEEAGEKPDNAANGDADDPDVEAEAAE
jgi:integrase